MKPPPPGVLLAYRFFGWRVGPEHAEWVRDDITRRGWLLRQGAPALALVLIVGAVLAALFDGDAARVLRLVVVMGVLGLLLRRSLQQRALSQQGIDASGQPLATAGWYTDEAARRRRNLVSVGSTVVLVVAGLAIIAARS